MPAAAETSADLSVSSKLICLGRKKKSGPLKRERALKTLLARRGAPLPQAPTQRLVPGNGASYSAAFLFPVQPARTGPHCQPRRFAKFHSGRPKTPLSPDRRCRRIFRPCHRTAKPEPLPSLESRAGEGRTSSPQHHHDTTAEDVSADAGSSHPRSIPAVPCLTCPSAPQSS